MPKVFYLIFSESQPQEPDNVTQETLELANQLNLEVTEEDLMELIREHNEVDLSFEEFREVMIDPEEHTLDSQCQDVPAIASGDIKEVLQQWDNVKCSLGQWSSADKVVLDAVDNMDRIAIVPLRKVLQNRQKQSKITEYFSSQSPELQEG